MILQLYIADYQFDEVNDERMIGRKYCGYEYWMPRHIVAVSPGEVSCDTAEANRMETLNATDYMVDCAFMSKVEKFMRHGKEDFAKIEGVLKA